MLRAAGAHGSADTFSVLTVTVVPFTVTSIGAEPAAELTKLDVNDPLAPVVPWLGLKFAPARVVDKVTGSDASAFPYASLSANTRVVALLTLTDAGVACTVELVELTAPAMMANALLTVLNAPEAACN